MNILDKFRVKVDLGVDCAENARKDLLWARVLETTAFALRKMSTKKVGRKAVESNLSHGRAHCRNNDHVIVILCEERCFARR